MEERAGAFPALLTSFSGGRDHNYPHPLTTPPLPPFNLVKANTGASTLFFPRDAVLFLDYVTNQNTICLLYCWQHEPLFSDYNVRAMIRLCLYHDRIIDVACSCSWKVRIWQNSTNPR